MLVFETHTSRAICSDYLKGDFDIALLMLKKLSWMGQYNAG